jgi:hypothetical protein
MILFAQGLWSQLASWLQSYPWIQIIDSSEKIATIAAIVFAGIAGYYKFLRGRMFRPRLEMTIVSALRSVEAQEYLMVNAKLKNTGLSKIAFDLPSSGLRIFAAKLLGERENTDVVNWDALATLELSDRHQWIESGETIEENWLVGLGAERNAGVFRSELRVAGKKTAWYADTIAEKNRFHVPKSERNEHNLQANQTET